MKAHSLSDAQWCFLDLLMRAKELGVARLNRLELLSSEGLPPEARAKLTFAGLTMPPDLVRMVGAHDFEITAEGEQVYRLRFGRAARPTAVADSVICLPGPDHYKRAN